MKLNSEYVWRRGEASFTRCAKAALRASAAAPPSWTKRQ
jgi:hypothetical protein